MIKATGVPTIFDISYLNQPLLAISKGTNSFKGLHETVLRTRRRIRNEERVNPSFDDATSYVVNLNGQDLFHELEGHTFSRRQRTRGLTSFAAITGISARNPQKGVSYEKRIGNGGTHRRC